MFVIFEIVVFIEQLFMMLLSDVVLELIKVCFVGVGDSLDKVFGCMFVVVKVEVFVVI